MNVAFRAANPGLCKFGLALVAFMQLLDMTVANVSLPTIAGNLGATTEQATWVITSFTVCNAIALPLTGWMVRRFGEVRLFIIATSLFTIASALCGLSSSMGMLTIFRSIQGFVAGPIAPVTQSLMVFLYPANRRTQAIAMITIVTLIAPMIGPILGGWITDSYSWPWIFYINLPVGIFGCYLAWSQLRHKEEKTQRVKLDYTGFVLLALGVGALQIMLDTGNHNDWFESNFIILMTIVAAISITAFLIWNQSAKHPIVDLHLFRHRNFAVGTLGLSIVISVFMGALVLMPMWMQVHLRYTPIWAGLALAPSGVIPLMIVPILGKHAHRFDLRLLMTIGVAIITTTFYIRSAYFNLQMDFASIALLQMLQGIGVPFVTISISAILISDLETNEIASGSGLSMCLRTLTSSFFISISQYLWHSRSVLHHSRLAERFTPGSPATLDAENLLFPGNTKMSMGILDYMINGQAYQISFNEVVFAFSLFLFACGMLIWFAKPPFERATRGS